MELKMKLGPKGQVVIPKQMREEFHFIPGDMLFFQKMPEGVFVHKPMADPVAGFRSIARRMKEKKVRINPHAYEEELEERWKKSST